jgi:hypothetical protein
MSAGKSICLLILAIYCDLNWRLNVGLLHRHFNCQIMILLMCIRHLDYGPLHIKNNVIITIVTIKLQDLTSMSSVTQFFFCLVNGTICTLAISAGVRRPDPATWRDSTGLVMKDHVAEFMADDSIRPDPAGPVPAETSWVSTRARVASGRLPGSKFNDDTSTYSHTLKPFREATYDYKEYLTDHTHAFGHC